MKKLVWKCLFKKLVIKGIRYRIGHVWYVSVRE